MRRMDQILEARRGRFATHGVWPECGAVDWSSGRRRRWQRSHSGRLSWTERQMKSAVSSFGLQCDTDWTVNQISCTGCSNVRTALTGHRRWSTQNVFKWKNYEHDAPMLPFANFNFDPPQRREENTETGRHWCAVHRGRDPTERWAAGACGIGGWRQRRGRTIDAPFNAPKKCPTQQLRTCNNRFRLANKKRMLVWSVDQPSADMSTVVSTRCRCRRLPTWIWQRREKKSSTFLLKISSFIQTHAIG